MPKKEKDYFMNITTPTANSRPALLSLAGALSLFIAFIFVQSLFFKFTNSYETQFIFGTLAGWSGFSWFGTYGGYLIGTAELIAAVLLFTRFHGVGAVMAVGIMAGAIFFHLFTPLGIVMPEFNAAGQMIGTDGGLLFGMACLIWLSAVVLVVRDSRQPQGLLHHVIHHFLRLSQGHSGGTDTENGGAV
ncbi:hypothetical protein P3TCK_11389 [Photobacterium profundum 3TCK]|uniref:Uncharacterized protein n=2 Tax=Photobacterium profundum TaxID=74109 RepID=Q1Z3G0_9GAMM|nr:hypothetical protein P3TCK_11389 [Photobacterium profundum 3TCK]